MKELLEIFKENKHVHKNNLSDIYKKVEEGICNSCGNCCSESVGASYAESLNIISYMKEQNIMTRNLMDSLVDYYLDIYIKRHKCPFLNKDNKCLIYEVRPLNCRIYGHWVEKDYEKNYKRLLNQSILISENLKKDYALAVSEDYLYFKIPYCKEYKGKIMAKDERNRLYNLLVKEDTNLILKNEIYMEYKDMGIVEHIISFSLNKDILFKLKTENRLSIKARNRIKDIAFLRWNSLV